MPSDSETLKLIEQDRNRRESALAALLLILGRNARRLLYSGMSIINALRRALLFPGVPVVARAMASAAAAGVRRVGLILGTTFDSGALEASLIPQYAPRAASALSSTVGTLAGKLAASLGLASFEPVSQEIAVVRAFQAAGFTDAHDHGARTAAAVAVLGPYAEGMAAAYRAPEVVDVVTGLRFSSIVDERRTDICKVRHGIKLPLGHEYIYRNFCPLHFLCRSLWLPLTGVFKASENPPEFPLPMPGFGRLAVPTELRAAG